MDSDPGRQPVARRTARSWALLAGAVVLLVTIGKTGAQGRPDTLAMSCAQVRATVLKQGAVVLGTGPFVFERYVSDRRYCAPTQRADTAFVRAADTTGCFAGYTCRERSRRDITR